MKVVDELFVRKSQTQCHLETRHTIFVGRQIGISFVSVFKMKMGKVCFCWKWRWEKFAFVDIGFKQMSQIITKYKLALTWESHVSSTLYYTYTCRRYSIVYIIYKYLYTCLYARFCVSYLSLKYPTIPGLLNQHCTFSLRRKVKFLWLVNL